MATISDREIKTILYRFIDLIDYYDRTITQNNCNNCYIKLECSHTPEAGEMVRINCPLWVQHPKAAEAEEINKQLEKFTLDTTVVIGKWDKEINEKNSSKVKLMEE